MHRRLGNKANAALWASVVDNCRTERPCEETPAKPLWRRLALVMMMMFIMVACSACDVQPYDDEVTAYSCRPGTHPTYCHYQHLAKAHYHDHHD